MKRIRGGIEELPVTSSWWGLLQRQAVQARLPGGLNLRWQEKDEVLEGWQQAQAPAALTAKARAPTPAPGS